MSVEEGSSAAWVPAWDALTNLEKQHGGRLATKALLADMLKDGELKARAGKLWESDVSDINDAWNSRDEVIDFETDVDVDPFVWQDSPYWIQDFNRWRWKANRFVITHQNRPTSRTFVEDVKFAADDLAALTLLDGSGSSERKRRGQHPDLQRWSRFWMAVVKMAQAQQLNRLSLGSKGQLNDKIRAAMEPPAFSERLIEPVASEIWEQFVSEKG